MRRSGSTGKCRAGAAIPARLPFRASTCPIAWCLAPKSRPATNSSSQCLRLTDQCPIRSEAFGFARPWWSFIVDNERRGRSRGRCLSRPPSPQPFCQRNRMRQTFSQHLKPFRREGHLPHAEAGDIAARSVKALNKTKADRVGAHVEYDGDCRSGIPRGCQRCRPTNCNDKGNLSVDQIRRERGQPIKLALGPAKFHRQVAAFHKSGFAQPPANCRYVFSIGRRRSSQNAKYRHRDRGGRSYTSMHVRFASKTTLRSSSCDPSLFAPPWPRWPPV